MKDTKEDQAKATYAVHVKCGANPRILASSGTFFEQSPDFGKQRHNDG